MEEKNDLTMLHEKLLMLRAGILEYETWYHDIIQWARSYLNSERKQEHTQDGSATTQRVKARPHVR
jgi:hypothetical protein